MRLSKNVIISGLIVGVILTLTTIVYFTSQKIVLTPPKISNASPVEICSKFDLTDNFGKLENLDFYTKNGTPSQDPSTLEVMLVGLHLRQNLDTKNSLHSTLDTASLYTVWIGDGSNYPVENYQSARANLIGFYNIKYSKLKNLSKKDFIQSVNCSELQTENKSKDKSENAISLIEDNIKTAENNPDLALSQRNDLVKIYNEIPFLLEDFAQVKSLGFEKFQNSLMEKAMLDYQEKRSKIPFNSSAETTRLKLGYDSNVNNAYFTDGENVILIGNVLTSGEDQKYFPNSTTRTSLISRNLKENKINWFLPDIDINHHQILIDQGVIFVRGTNVNETDSSISSILKIDLKTGKILKEYKLTAKQKDDLGGIDDFIVTESNELIIITSLNSSTPSKNITKIYNLSQDKLLFSQEMNNLDSDFAISSDGRYFTYVTKLDKSAPAMSFEYFFKVMLVDLKDSNPAKTNYKLAWTADFEGRHIKTSFKDGKLDLFINTNNRNDAIYDNFISYDIATSKIEKLPLKTVLNLAMVGLAGQYGIVNKDKTKLAILDSNNRYILKLFKIVNGDLILEKTINCDDELQGFDQGYNFSPDGKTLLLTSRYGELHLYDL